MASLHCDLGPLSVIEYVKCVSSQYLLLLLWVSTSLVLQGVFFIAIVHAKEEKDTQVIGWSW